MGFLTPALLGGVLLVALPIVLHLVMRRQPRKVPFPALQFVRNRQEANRRRLNLRHWLLLALRCALIAGLALALARPTLKGSGLRGKEGAPLAVALVVDNSLRMQYIHQNRPRLEEAAEMATWLIGRLPEETELAVLDLSRSSSGFVNEVGTAEARLRNLQSESSPRPLDDAVREAIDLLTDHDDYRQEMFLFTDLSVAAWDETAVQSINEALSEAPGVRIYVVDVGARQPKNMALGELQLRSHILRPGESLHLEALLEATNLLDAPLVELFLTDKLGRAVKRGQKTVDIAPDGSGRVTFEISDLPLGVHQGYIQLASIDPLEIDNTRYFTVEVRPQAKVLILGERPSDALFLREALSPSLLADRTAVQFQCTTERFSGAMEIDFETFEAICMLDPPPLSDPLWEKLVTYADVGGGVGLFLGERAQAGGFNTSAAVELLPGPLKRKSRLETYFRPKRLDHPALIGLRDYADSIPWQAYSVFKYWEFGDMSGDAYVVARFANQQPALVERPVGRGRVLTLSTPVSDPLQLVTREPWNLLPAGPWPFVPLCNQIVGYLAQNENRPLDFLAGETVNLRLTPQQLLSSFVLHQPDGESLRRTLPPGDDTIRIGTTRQLGNYRVASGGESKLLDRGFSINSAAELMRLERVDPDQLADSLPADQVQLARTISDVERTVNIGRSGRELFPWAITLVALVWGAEHLLANRFYRGAP